MSDEILSCAGTNQTGKNLDKEEEEEEEEEEEGLARFAIENTLPVPCPIDKLYHQ